jgi:hypothetical protein|tara:strand:+ start:405 stop:608 length:204 start_codon:yes stop_codon:yes gene_type:complete
MITVYGSTDNTNTHTDTSKTLLGAKQYATRHGLKNVSVRIGYNITLLEYKRDNKWYTYKGFIDELFA